MPAGKPPKGILKGIGILKQTNHQIYGESMSNQAQRKTHKLSFKVKSPIQANLRNEEGIKVFLKVLIKCGGHITKACEEAGIDRADFYRLTRTRNDQGDMVNTPLGDRVMDCIEHVEMNRQLQVKANMLEEALLDAGLKDGILDDLSGRDFINLMGILKQYTAKLGENKAIEKAGRVATLVPRKVNEEDIANAGPR